MNIIVCIKQVPDTNEVKIDPQTGTMIREGVPSIINSDDKHALEEALRLKGDGKVTVLSMGPPQTEEALREALALGVDEAILLSDRKFAGSDTIATSYVLANAIKKLGNFDLVLCGREAMDGNTAQIGPQIAELLNLPQLTYAKKIEINNNKITVHRALEDNIEVVETELPALVTVIKDINMPRYMSLKGILEASKKEVKILTANGLDVDEAKLGLKGSPTLVKKSFPPPQKAKGELIQGNPKEVAKILVQKLKDNNVI